MNILMHTGPKRQPLALGLNQLRQVFPLLQQLRHFLQLQRLLPLEQPAWSPGPMVVVGQHSGMLPVRKEGHLALAALSMAGVVRHLLIVFPSIARWVVLQRNIPCQLRMADVVLISMVLFVKAGQMENAAANMDGVERRTNIAQLVVKVDHVGGEISSDVC